jgi:hypothetical protein
MTNGENIHESSKVGAMKELKEKCLDNRVYIVIKREWLYELQINVTLIL